jgi:hypothetical protein
MFRMPGINIPVLGVIENMSYFTPAELPENKYYIFGKRWRKRTLAEQYDVPFLGEIPLVQSITEAGDNGEPISHGQGQFVIHCFCRNSEEKWHSKFQSTTGTGELLKIYYFYTLKILR